MLKSSLCCLGRTDLVSFDCSHASALLLLQLLRVAAQLPDTAQLLARPVRLGSVQASVLGCLTALAEGPAARLLLDCDKLSSSSASLAAGRAEEQQLQQLQVKMARKVRETHAALAVSGGWGAGGGC
uniref:155027m n=1 Tax=Chlamydomonas reinhardtii TaxID=3055 RepID=D5LB02_CHLRE|nr:155027m [Chlamydomonas reinhardtii]